VCRSSYLVGLQQPGHDRLHGGQEREVHWQKYFLRHSSIPAIHAAAEAIAAQELSDVFWDGAGGGSDGSQGRMSGVCHCNRHIHMRATRARK
jgi:hypothetical protein